MLLTCCFITSLHAAPKQQSLNYSTGLGSPITTTTTDILSTGEWGISQRAEYYANNPLSDITLIMNPTAESQYASFINYFMLNYGLGEKITLGASLPYTYTFRLRVVNSIEESGNYSFSNLGNISGAGDITIFSLVQLRNEDQSPFSVAILTGTNTPTGKTTVRDNQGMLFAAEDQPGSGAWTPFGALIVTKKWEKVLLSGNLIYTHYLRGTQQTTLGSLFDYNFAAVIEMYQDKKDRYQLNGILELTGEFAAYNKVAGIIEPDSGGKSLFILPGLRANINSYLSVYLGVGLPLFERYHGAQVTTRYNAISGIDLSF